MRDVQSLAYQLSFEGHNIKSEEVISFVSIVEDLFIARYKEKDKIEITSFCWQQLFF
jgi:hypothetical protein